MRVLLADTDAEREAAVQAALTRLDAACILRPEPGETLVEAVGRLTPDVVIVDMARPDRDTLDDVRSLSRAAPHPVVMFTNADDPGFMQDAIDAGVSSYNVVGRDLPDVRPIILAAIALFRRYRQVEAELQRAELVLQERAVIERAKAALIRRRRMTEPEAYRWLRRQAMDRGRRIVDVAAALLETLDG